MSTLSKTQVTIKSIFFLLSVVLFFLVIDSEFVYADARTAGATSEQHCEDSHGHEQLTPESRKCTNDGTHPEVSTLNNTNNSGGTSAQGSLDPNRDDWACLIFAGCWTPMIVGAGGWMIMASAAVFDFFIHETLRTTYLDSPGVINSWALIRDLANITFILGIIAVAIMMITGITIPGLKDWKTLITRLIIVALLLNFSLFFTHVVIDAGNILGKFFYTQITNGAPANDALEGVISEEIPSPAQKIATRVNLLNLIDIEAINTAGQGGNRNVFWFTFNITYLLLSVLLAYSLFKVGFMMLSRTVWLIILSIASPVALVAYFLPFAEGLIKSWWKHLFNKSFCLCVYLFMIYLLFVIMDGLQTNGLTLPDDGIANWWVGVLIYVSIQVMVVFVILNTANKQAEKMCEGGFGLGSTLSKFTVGAAATVGSTGLMPARALARFGVGATGKKITESTTIANMALSKNKLTSGFANALYSGGEAASKAKIGLKRGYTDQLVDQSKKRITRADAFANNIKKPIEQEVIKEMEAPRRSQIGLEEQKRLAQLDKGSKEYTALYKEVAERLKSEGQPVNQASMSEAMQKEFIQRAGKKADAADIQLDKGKVAEEVATRTKKRASDLLEQNRGSLVDFALAGAVPAYTEAADSYEVIDKADNRKKRERAQQIAGRAKLSNEYGDVVNNMARQSESMIDTFTDDDRGIIIDERSIDTLVDEMKSSKMFDEYKEGVVKAHTTEYVDDNGVTQTQIDTKGIESTMANLETELRGLSKFETRVANTSTAWKESQDKVTEAQEVFDSATTDKEREAARRDLNDAKRDLKDADVAQKQVAQELKKSALSAFGKTEGKVKGNFKTKIDTAVALGTAEQLFASQEGADLGDQARDGEAAKTQIEENLAK